MAWWINNSAATAKSAFFGATSGFSAVGGSIAGLLGVRTKPSNPTTNQESTSTNDHCGTPNACCSTSCTRAPARDAWQFAVLPTSADASNTLARAKKLIVDGAKVVGTSFEKLTIASLQALDLDGSEPVVKNSVIPTTTIVYAVDDPVGGVVLPVNMVDNEAEKVEADKAEVVQKSDPDKPNEPTEGDKEVGGPQKSDDKPLSEADITTAL
ncbi:hypothetical protein BJ742DRAFT_734100 [Cladochytrium replicatum]|nr:hypothetical protein BJ742DRAFT_734100 [Cladochytrium replicatum]